MKDKFQEMYNQTAAPGELKDSVLKKMKEAQLKEEAEPAVPKSRPLRMKLRYPVLAAAAAVICFLAYQIWNDNTIYKTPLKDGEFLKTVELQDGYLQFLEEDSFVALTPNAGTFEKENDKPKEGERKVISMKGGGTITVEKTQGGHTVQLPDQLMSHMEGQELILLVLDEKKGFEGEYESDGCLYRISGKDVTQKQFIDFLSDLIKQGGL